MGRGIEEETRPRVREFGTYVRNDFERGEPGEQEMNRINLAVLWHMHQPQYRDPETGKYVLPWTRLHATKDYYGMIKLFEEFPAFHATFNMVPSLCLQLEEYASGKFKEPWFDLAFKNAEQLTREDKSEISGARVPGESGKTVDASGPDLWNCTNGRGERGERRR